MKTAILIVLFVAAIAATGCASSIEGVEITEEERAACAKSKDCTVWSDAQLQALMRHFFIQGFAGGQRAQ